MRHSQWLSEHPAVILHLPLIICSLSRALQLCEKFPCSWSSSPVVPACNFSTWYQESWPLSSHSPTTFKKKKNPSTLLMLEASNMFSSLKVVVYVKKKHTHSTFIASVLAQLLWVLINFQWLNKEDGCCYKILKQKQKQKNPALLQ